jgi:hypothetical protein
MTEQQNEFMSTGELAYSNRLNDKQQKAFSAILKEVDGLSYKEAEKMLYEVLFELKKKATIKS